MDKKSNVNGIGAREWFGFAHHMGIEETGDTNEVHVPEPEIRPFPSTLRPCSGQGFELKFGTWISKGRRGIIST